MHISKPLLLLIIIMILSSIVLQLKIIMLKGFSSQSFNSDSVLGIDHTFDKNDLLSIILIMIPSFARLLTFNHK